MNTCPSIVLGPILDTAEIGFDYDDTIAVAGGQVPIVFSIVAVAGQSGLPTGLGMSPVTGRVAGTPTQTGDWVFLVVVTDANQCRGSRVYSINVVCAAITVTIDPAAATVGVAYTGTATAASGLGPYTYTWCAAAPGGLTLDPTTGAITGTPTEAVMLCVRATDAAGCTGDAGFFICSAISLDDTLPDGVVGAAYSGTLAASGGSSPYIYVLASGSWPDGLALNASTGAITGTPTTPGTFDFTITATDVNGCAGSRAYEVVISLALIDHCPGDIGGVSLDGGPCNLDLSLGPTLDSTVQTNIWDGTFTAWNAGGAYTICGYAMNDPLDGYYLPSCDSGSKPKSVFPTRHKGPVFPKVYWTSDGFKLEFWAFSSALGGYYPLIWGGIKTYGSTFDGVYTKTDGFDPATTKTLNP